MTARSWLFVPGDAPAKMEKACASGADAVILDLEDSVAASAKAEARDRVAEFLQGAGARTVEHWVRVNPLGSGLTAEELKGVVRPGLSGIVLPKAEGVEQILALAEQLAFREVEQGVEAGAIRILPLVTETPKSLFALHDYDRASSRLAGLTWGAEDLSAAVGALSPRDEAGRLTSPYMLARSLCLFAAAAAETSAIETVYPAFRDLDGLATYAGNARRDGFAGMLAIHPAQVAVINQAFTPTEREIERARRIVALFNANPEAGTLGMDGEMLDRPHLQQARRTLARVNRTASS